MLTLEKPTLQEPLGTTMCKRRVVGIKLSWSEGSIGSPAGGPALSLSSLGDTSVTQQLHHSFTFHSLLKPRGLISPQPTKTARISGSSPPPSSSGQSPPNSPASPGLYPLCSLSHCALLAFPLLLHNKFPQNLVAKTTIAFIISPGFCGTGIRERLSWAVLAQGLQGGCRQRDCSHPKAGLGWGSRSRTAPSPGGRDPEGGVSSPPSSDLRSLKGQPHTRGGRSKWGNY